MPGIFGNRFDLNHDGKMSPFEKAADRGFLRMIMKEEEKKKKEQEKNKRKK
ncbi:MAG: hypothetical protein Q4B70_07390 [Lachnospiraceae bacterium]|nr:hypothetical protein [Lachnospiraceae bacterium]